MLVVEDDADLRSVYRNALSMAGYAVVVAEDGLGALQRIEQERPGAIVLDLGLPRLGGRDVHREISSQAHTRDIPVVIVTGLDTSDLADEGVACTILRKPVDAEAVVAAVRKCVRPGRGFSLFR